MPAHTLVMPAAQRCGVEASVKALQWVSLIISCWEATVTASSQGHLGFLEVTNVRSVTRATR